MIRLFQCDEKLPCCSPCERDGKNCPGPVSGSIFLSTNPAAQRQRALKTSSKRRPTISPDVVGTCPRPFFTSSHALSTHSADSDLGDSHALDVSTKAVDNRLLSPKVNDRRAVPSTVPGSSSYQPNVAPILEQHFLALFISFFDKAISSPTPPKGWFAMLPSMLSNTIRSYVRAPILAVSLALYGTVAQEQTIVLIAFKWYGVGLARQRKRLIDNCKGEQAMIPTVEDISMALLSSYFEVFFSTTPEAYFHHQRGASNLLEARGPEACRTGVLHELFQTVRFHMVCILTYTEIP